MKASSNIKLDDCVTATSAAAEHGIRTGIAQAIMPGIPIRQALSEIAGILRTAVDVGDACADTGAHAAGLQNLKLLANTARLIAEACIEGIEAAEDSMP
jgi:hypothetical protein